jgi:uncharacterized protein (TIGR02145 family)
MKKAITLFIFSMVVVFLFSCGEKTDNSHNSEASRSERKPSNKDENNRDNSDLKTQENAEQILQDIDGNIYNTVKIDRQTWMAKNLKTTRYNDGTAIPLVTDEAAWAALSTPGYCWYNSDSVTYKNTYGALHNGYTVITDKLCPAGWHVPSDEEWTRLTDYLGGQIYAGDRLKETGTDYWVSPNTGATNDVGYTALPGGLRYHDGIFHDFGFSGYWWTSTEYSSTRAYFRYIDYEYSELFRFNNLKKIGFSVRCIRDY